MSEQSPLTKFHAALRGKTEATVVRENLEPNRIRIILRVPKGPSTQRWLAVAAYLLERGNGDKAPWGIDISKQYFLVGGQMRFGWRIIFQGEDLVERVNAVAPELQNLKMQAIQLDEIPLYGSPNRSKTAGLMGTVHTMR